MYGTGEGEMMVRLSVEVQVDFRLSLNLLREGHMVAR